MAAATCAAADDLPSPTLLGGADGGMTTLDYGICELLPAPPDRDWRLASAAVVHRPSFDDIVRSTTPAAAATAALAVDCYGDPVVAGDVQGRMKCGVDEDVEFDTRLCWATYHHLPAAAGGDTSVSDACRTTTSIPSPTTSSFRPSVRTTAAAAAAAITRTHVYEMPQFQS